MAYLCMRPEAKKDGFVETARTQPAEDCIMVASMKRLSTPVELATSRMESSMEEISSALLRSTSQASQESSICCLLFSKLSSC